MANCLLCLSDNQLVAPGGFAERHRSGLPVRGGVRAVLRQVPGRPRGPGGGRAGPLNGHAQQKPAAQRGGAHLAARRHARRPGHQPGHRQGSCHTDNAIPDVR